jgi:hypothetical protein
MASSTENQIAEKSGDFFAVNAGLTSRIPLRVLCAIRRKDAFILFSRNCMLRATLREGLLVYCESIGRPSLRSSDSLLSRKEFAKRRF